MEAEQEATKNNQLQNPEHLLARIQELEKTVLFWRQEHAMAEGKARRLEKEILNGITLYSHAEENGEFIEWSEERYPRDTHELRGVRKIRIDGEFKAQ